MDVPRYDVTSICRRCLDLFDRAPAEGLRQRCDCDRLDEPTWPRHDFNRRVELCRCCHGEVLRSGSRFSVWFCEPCKDLAVASNDAMQRWLIPIGRHSFMVHTYGSAGAILALPGRVATAAARGDADARRELETFQCGIVSMISSHERLKRWSRAKLGALLDELDFPADEDVDLTDFLRRLRSMERQPRFGRRSLFLELRDAMAAPMASRR